MPEPAVINPPPQVRRAVTGHAEEAEAAQRLRWRGPGWRQGGVMLMLWSSLGSFMQQNGFERVVGCASVPMFDGGQLAADLWHMLKAMHLAPADEQVRPRLPLPVQRLVTGRVAAVPALIKGYPKCGGKLLSAPAWDPDFGTADRPMMLRLSDLPGSYRRRFIGA